MVLKLYFLKEEERKRASERVRKRARERERKKES